MSSPTAPADGASRARPRVTALALAGVVPIALFVQWSDLRVGGTMASGPYPPLAACILWAGLLGLNHLRARRQAAFLRPDELLVILAVWLTANIVVGRGMLHALLCTIAGPTYYARGGAMAQAVARDLPGWLVLRDRAAATRFFEGYGVPVPWALWAPPLATWTLFFVPFLLANVCMCALFERIWVREERLAFPLVAIPAEILGSTHAAPAPGARVAIAAGLALPLLLHGFGAAHAYVPGIPCVPFYNEVTEAITQAPWTAARPMFLNLYPLLVGVSFLAPADVTFSVWFFLLLNKAETVAAAATGWSEGSAGGGLPSPPYVEEQSAGAFLALAAVLAWSAWRRRRAAPRPQGDRAERWLLAGFRAGVLGTLAWCVITGMPLWIAVGMIGFTLAVALVLARLMAEGGITWLLAPILPDKLIVSIVGSATLSSVTVTRLMLQVQHLRDARQLLAPAVMQAGKMRDVAGYPRGRFYALLLAGIALSLAVGTAAALPLLYEHGALALAPVSDGLQMNASVIPNTAVGHASMRLSGTIPPSPAAGVAVLVGAAATCALAWMRMRAAWWPLHPLGYALTGTLQLGYANKMLLSVMLGWGLKCLAMRYGGARGYRLLRGAAIGMVLGDLAMGAALKLLDALLGPSGYGIL